MSFRTRYRASQQSFSWHVNSNIWIARSPEFPTRDGAINWAPDRCEFSSPWFRDSSGSDWVAAISGCPKKTLIDDPEWNKDGKRAYKYCSYQLESARISPEFGKVRPNGAYYVGYDLGRNWTTYEYFYTSGWRSNAFSVAHPKAYYNAMVEQNNIPFPVHEPPYSEIEMRSLALRDACPDPEVAISTLNFIVELRDFRGIFDNLRRLQDELRAMAYIDPAALSAAVKRYFGVRKLIATGKYTEFREKIEMFLRQGLSHANVGADQILEWNFAVAPLISDLADMLCLGLSLKNEWEFSKTAAKAVKPIRTRGRYTYVSPITTRNFSSYWVHRDVNNAVCDYSKTVSVVVTCSYKARVDRNAPNPFELFAQRYGLVIQPSVVWNAIPGSFILDYVSNIGDIVESCDSPMSLYETVDIKGYSRLDKSEYSFLVTRNDPVTAYDGGSFYVSTYGRNPGSFRDIAGPIVPDLRLKWPSEHAKVMLGALAVSILGRRLT